MISRAAQMYYHHSQGEASPPLKEGASAASVPTSSSSSSSSSPPLPRPPSRFTALHIAFLATFGALAIYSPAWHALAFFPLFCAAALTFAHHPLFKREVKGFVAGVTAHNALLVFTDLLERDWAAAARPGTRTDMPAGTVALWGVLCGVGVAPLLYLVYLTRSSPRG